MPDMFYNPIDWSLDTRQLNVSSNAPVGIPRSEQVVALTDNKLHLVGPPIEINHPSEYNPLDYYCNSGSETMKNGVAGIKNLTTGDWLSTFLNEVSEVDETGTELTISNNFISKDDECIIYYYAKPAWSGGKKVTPVQGDLWSPAVGDVLLRKANDSTPAMFGYSSDDTGDIYEFAPDMMYNTGTTAGASSWTTLLDYNVTGTFRQSDFPVYATETTIHFTDPEASWPDTIWVDIEVDGESMYREYSGSFGDYNDHLEYFNFDPAIYTESGGPYTEAPGNIMSENGHQMFFDVYHDVNDKMVFRFDTETEVLSDYKVRIYCVGTALSDVECYVRGWFVN